MDVTVYGAAVGRIMKSEGTRVLLHRKAEQVAARVRSAGILVEGVPGDVELPVRVSSDIGPTRARAQVSIDHPSGLAVEAKHRILGSSIDAARL